MRIRIRDAGKGDHAAVVRLIGELAATSGEQSPITEEYAGRYLSSPVSKILLAEEDGKSVGLLGYSIRPDLYHAGDACLIEELIVREKSRGRGVGSALLTELFSRLTAAGCAEVSLAVMPGNLRAIDFYQNSGLTEEAILLERHFPGSDS
jgi:ribosomal protein S18 acetylase RimI-like enzyme